MRNTLGVILQQALLLALVIATGSARAQAPAATVATPGDELAQVRLSGSVDDVSGSQTAAGQQTTYTGSSPSDIVIEGWGWLPSLPWLGGTVRAEREGVGLFDGPTRVGAGAMLNASAGPAARLRLGALRLELALGYAYVQAISTTGTTGVALGGVSAHSAMLATRGNLTVGPVDLEGRVGVASALAGDATGLDEWHFGGGVRVGVYRAGELDLGVRADVEFRQIYCTSAAAGEILFNRNRYGLAFDLLLRSPEPPKAIVKPAEGALRVVVLAASGETPLAAAQVEIERPPGSPPAPLMLGSDGTHTDPNLPPGPVIVRARLEGYLPAELRAEVVVGSEAEARLLLVREPPKVGGLIATVRDNATKAPLANVTIKVGDASATTDAAGVARFGDLAAGAVSITFTAPGYKDGSDAAVIVVGVESPADLFLQPRAVKAPARISGRVRSARGGAPVAATVALKETSATSPTGPDGTFALSLPSGVYTVTISADGYVAQTKKISMREGESAIYNVNLVPR